MIPKRIKEGMLEGGSHINGKSLVPAETASSESVDNGFIHRHPCRGYMLNKTKEKSMTKKTRKVIEGLENRITALEGQVQAQTQNIAFNGNYELKDKADIDYFMNEACKLIKRRNKTMDDKLEKVNPEKITIENMNEVPDEEWNLKIHLSVFEDEIIDLKKRVSELEG